MSRPETSVSLIKEAIWSVCTDGNSDPNRVARDVIKALDGAGFVVVPREPTEAMMAAVDCAGEKRRWPSGQAWLDGWAAMIGACK